MKTYLAALTITAVAFTILLPNNAFASNTPIPGIDIVVKKQPAGGAMKTTTDKSGKFSFTKLEAGTYSVTISPAPKGDATAAKAIISTTRSQIIRPSALVVNGAEVHDLVVSLGTTAPAPVTIVLEKAGGTISGTVTAATLAKEPATTGDAAKREATGAENTEKALPTGKRMHKPF
jgi:hypothetical protein